jgi:hypothetical protein
LGGDAACGHECGDALHRGDEEEADAVGFAGFERGVCLPFLDELEQCGVERPPGPTARSTITRHGAVPDVPVFYEFGSGEDGARVLMIGGVPGRAYEPQENTPLGGPETLPCPTASTSLIPGSTPAELP